MTPHGQKEIVITGIGVVTSVGYQAPQTLTSILAGICRFKELSSFQAKVRDPSQHFPEPAIAAPASALTDGLVGIERLLALGRPALQEALADANLDDKDLVDTEVLLAGGQRPETAAASRTGTVLGARLIAPIARGMRLPAPRYFPAGSAGALLALDVGMQRMQQGQCRRCVVGGVDSWLDTETLAELDRIRRLKTAEIPDGFLPGEAAAFVVIERAVDAARRRRTAYARCSGVFTAQESSTIEGNGVCTAQALSSCLRGAVDGLRRNGKLARAVLCDLNGESYRSTEWAYALARVFQGDRSPPPATLTHPADCVGDVGAATGALLLALGAHAINHEPGIWDATLVWCSSDKGERAACSLESPS